MQIELSARLGSLRTVVLESGLAALPAPYPAFTLFLSVSDGPKRAEVIHASAGTVEAAWDAAVASLQEIMTRKRLAGRWLRVDWLTGAEEITIEGLRKRLTRFKRNYFRYGLAFGSDLQIAFTEQELNANAMLYGGNLISHAVVNEGNIGVYARRRYGPDCPIDLAGSAVVHVLSTAGIFCDEDGVIHRLPGPGRNAGRRDIERLTIAQIERLIADSSSYLSRQVLEDGRFVYGYHPCFDREIGAYNALRHASTTYSMIEAWEIIRDGALKESIDRALVHLKEVLIRPVTLPDGTKAAFVVDEGGEIKLGANAVAILALTKLATLTGSTADHALLEKLALGIRHMQNPADGSFTHVLNYPSLTVKAAYRTIYYEGEAAFGLMRLYNLTGDERWIETVEKAFGHFIRAEHWQHHDHWLSYCVNELTRHRPEERYFRFGIQNIAGYLDFVLERITTFPTLLELMMAGREMLERIRAMPDMRHLLNDIDLDKFYRALEHRAHYLLNGHFWPEMAMFFARPESIVGSFFIRHHAFRVRIDDVEHYLSGFVAYLKYRRAAESSEAHSETAGDGGWKADELQALLGGTWISKPSEDWQADDMAILANGSDIHGSRCLFVAIDESTWLNGTRNTGHYAVWADTHDALPKFHDRCCGAIVQRPVKGLPEGFPQLVVKNSYDILQILADDVRRRLTGKVFAVTGTVGKSTTKDMLTAVLSRAGSVIATRRNHNSRAGVSVTLARCVTDPDFAVVEVAMSALWTRSGGVCPRVRPHVTIVTEIGISQVGPNIRDINDVARFKARICNGMEPGGHAVLNRDMAEYDFVAEEVRRFGAHVVSYGFHPEADVRVLECQAGPASSQVKVLIDGDEFEYQLNVPGRSMVSNSLAVITAAKLVGVDLKQAAATLATYAAPGKLETKPLPLAGGGALLIDDCYNAEILSMKAAFEATQLQPLAPGARRIAVLGRIINLGNQAPALHASLAEPLVAAGFDRVYMQGEEMLHLHQQLPERMNGGLFDNAAAVAEAVMGYVREGDIILVKGDVRATDFGSVPKLLLEAAATRTRALSAGDSAGLLVDAGSGEVLQACNEVCSFSPRHLSQLLLIALAADQISEGKLRLADAVAIRPLSSTIAGSGLTTGLPVGSKVTVSELIRAMVVLNARDAAVSLAEHIFGKSDAATRELQAFAARIGMNNTVIRNVSGREQTGQRTTLKDIARLVEYLWERHPHRLHWFSVSEAAFGGKVFRTSGNLVAGAQAHFVFSSGGSQRWGFAISRMGSRTVIACAAGAHDAFNLDYRLDSLLAAAGQPQGETAPQRATAAEITTEDRPVRINMLGDTYFGEWYSARRRKREVEDALTLHGYDHSFMGLRDFFAEGDFNIANFEGALSSTASNRLAGRKPFVLTGDPGKSVEALKRAGIHAVALGNNHAVDAGPEGLAEALRAFDDAGIVRFGAGMNAAEAEAPLVLQAAGRTVKVFSAYWYRTYMEQDCAFYALPRRAGAACLSGGLLDTIRTEKQKDDPATVIVMAHWGTDYAWTSDTQRSLAKGLVEAGADLVIGSGPHMLGEFERLNGRWVAYSIGNGVFNSDGEYQRRGVPPYSFVARLLLGTNGMELCLYPILTDNRQTFWQPRFLSTNEFDRVLEALESQGISIARARSDTSPWQDIDEAGRPMIVLPSVS